MNKLSFSRNACLFLWCLLGIASEIFGQRVMSLEEALKTALENNPALKIADLKIEESVQLRKTSTETGKLSAMWLSGQYNSLNTDNNITLTQTLPLPTTMAAQSRLGKAVIAGDKLNQSLVRQQLLIDVADAFDQLLFLQKAYELRKTQDSLYKEVVMTVNRRFISGEATALEKLTAETKSLEIGHLLLQGESDIKIQQSRLGALLKTNELIVAHGVLKKMDWKEIESVTEISNNPYLKWSMQQIQIGDLQTKVERNLMMPDVTVGYFNQSLIGFQRLNGQEIFYDRDKKFTGFQLGLAVPLWFGPQLARSKAASFRTKQLEFKAEEDRLTLSKDLEQAKAEFQKALRSITFYESSANQQANLLARQSEVSYQSGELSLMNFLETLRSVAEIKFGYQQAIRQYNQSILKIQYLTGYYENH